jgi:adenylate kinase
MDNIEEKIKAIEEEISKTSYNKATSHHIGKLKAKISKLKEEQIKRSSGGSKGEGFHIKKSGDATAVLVGFPSVGKSTLLNELTNAESKVGAYEFTTLEIIPGIMEYNNAQMFHVFDEAQELAEKIAEAAEKNEPKTPEERREDMIEDATGVENDGLLDEIMDNLTEAVEEVPEEMVEDLQQSSEEILSEDELNQMILTEEEQLEKLEQEKRIPANYIPFDYRV